MRPRSYLLSLALLLAACGTSRVTIGGTVTGLAGSGLVLQNNGGDDLAVTADGTFTFAATVEAGAAYAVTVKQQPSGPTQLCDVTNGNGTAGDADVTTVQVSCHTQTFTVSGTVTGLAGSGLVLEDNGADDLAISADGTFTFAAPVASGAAYAVTVKMQPSSPTQMCVVANGTGTIADANVTNVAITCTTSAFTIGGTVTGLSGTGLVLQDKGGDDLPITADGSFTFATPVLSGQTFDVTVLTQPSGLSQTCTVSGGTGTVGGGNVTSIAVNCMTNAYTIGGTISGLVGTVTLQNNAGDDLDVTSNGTFAFATPVLSGGTYDVTVKTQPTNPWQTCVVSMGSGTVTDADITSVVVTCTTNQYTIGGTISGLANGDSITLRDNGGDTLVRSTNGAFTFATSIASGQTYSVTTTSPASPISQTCTVTNGSGMVTNANITSVVVTCTTNSFTVGGTVGGLTGTGLVLQDNGGDDLAINADGTFTFATPIASGAPYNVKVKTQPSGVPCGVSNGAGTMGASNVTNVQVICGSMNWSTSLFPIAIAGAQYGLGDVALDNNGDLLVTVNPQHAIVKVNHLTGALTTIATGIGLSTSYLMGVAYRPANDMIYTQNEAGQIFTVTPTGTVTLLATYMPGEIAALALAPATFGSYGGFLIGVVNSTGAVIAIDPTTGAITTIATIGGGPSDLAFAPDGTLYVSGVSTVRTVTATGQVSTFATGLGSADGITIAPDGTRMFIADSGTDTVRQITIPGAVVSTYATADIDDGWGVGGIVAAPGNTLIVMTGETSLTLRAFGY